MKASFTAAMVVRSLLVALGDVWVVGGVVVRREVCGGVDSVVVAVDMFDLVPVKGIGRNKRMGKREGTPWPLAVLEG